MTRTSRLAILAAAAMGLAACSGPAPAPQVASLGSSSASQPAAGSTPAAGTNPTRLLDEWAACIRRHGDPGQADPAINASKDIEITMDNVSKGLEDEVHGSTGPCSGYLLAAQTALRGGQAAPADNTVTAVKEAQCIRASGIANYPDPSTNGESDFNGTGVNPDSPAVQDATKACDKKLGIPYYGNGSAPPGVVQVFGCSAPAGVRCPSGPPADNGGSTGNG